MPNRLIKEKSPYLLQHAHNPVDWYPWGEEAFTKARSENKPIFLSIGYSTCYWCHVMEREVFENEAIAGLMNEKLVCIKVDREEQPDIDRIYMTSVQLMTGSGGWPMSVFLTHDLKPFFGGTYFPPDSRYGRPGFPQLVERISELWLAEHDKLVESAHSVVQHITNASYSQTELSLSESVLTTCFNFFKQAYDPIHGGFGHAPKFPRPVAFNLLLSYYAQTGNKDALDITLTTLRKMALSGMYDQLGGGFHRYSVDEQWRVPHFEKMLYDQGQLCCSYLDAYQITHDKFFADVAREVLEYVLREMTHPEGGFYSAEDAESAFSHEEPHEKEEGTFYLWTTSEIESILGKDSSLFCFHFGVEPTGNAPSDPMCVFQNKNILYQCHPLGETAKKFNISVSEAEEILLHAKNQLFSERNKRPHPHLDDKIITAWNGLMISAFAKASQLLQIPMHLETATRAAEFIISHSYNVPLQTLYRRWRDGEARFPGCLQDYAFFIKGLLDLYEASFDVRWLKYAITFNEWQLALFWDEQNGGFFDSSEATGNLFVRMKEDYDGAEPTGNSIATHNLLRLGHITDNEDWKRKADFTMKAFSTILNKRPDALAQMLVGLEWSLTSPKELIVSGDKDSEETKLILEEIHKHFIPNKILLLADGSQNQQFIEAFLPFIKTLKHEAGNTTFFLCENFACKLPTSDITVIRESLLALTK